MPVNLDQSSSEIGSVFFCRQTGMSELSANSVVREASQENNGKCIRTADLSDGE